MVAVGGAGGACALVGCSAGPRDFENENDRLRGRVVEAERRIAALEETERRLTAELDGARRASPAAQAMALLPRAERLVVGRLSGPVRTGTGTRNAAGVVEAVDLYLSPLDGRGRFVQVVGSLSVRVDLIPGPPRGGAGATLAEPRLVGTLTLAPEELREAYRSGLTGTHYSVRVPVRDEGGLGIGSLSVTVGLEDAVFGSRLEAVEVFALRGEAGAGG